MGAYTANHKVSLAITVIGLVTAACAGGGTDDPTVLRAPTEANALEFVADPANQPAFEAKWSTLFSEPRVPLEARLDGDCVAVRFVEEGDSGEEPWTIFLRWEEDGWEPQGVTLIPGAIEFINPALDGCYG